MSTSKLLGEILVSEGLLDEENLESALIRQTKTGKRLGEVLLEMDYISSLDMVKALEKQGFERLDLIDDEPEWELLKQMEEKIMRKNKIVPYKIENDVLYVVISDPYNYQALDYARDYFHALKCKAFVGSEDEIKKTIDKVFTVSYFEDEDQVDEIEEEEEDISELMLEDSPIVKHVNQIIEKAISEDASDIHIEPQIKGPTLVRFRIDGELLKITTIPRNWTRRVVSRVKIMASMDIAEKRKPQDGKILYTHSNKTENMRVSTMPNVNGEKVVIRLLGQGSSIMKLDRLEFDKNNYEKVKKIINERQGIILIAGPTGSGKSTTLYSILSELNTENVNISTVEDPVEIKIPNVNQSQTSTKIKFVDALRSFLRQDPDIIMVGEIRDKETADLAVRASLTGHLLLSTIHTNDAVGVIPRFIDMGIQPYLIADALKMVISQRLLRRICPRCKVVDVDGLKKAKSLFPEKFKGVNKIYKGEGCSYCNDLGYKGRIAVHEVFTPNDKERFLISNKDTEKLKTEVNFQKINIDAIKKVKEGITSIDELVGKLGY